MASRKAILGSVQVSALRAVFSGLEPTAPALGAALATRLWCAVPRHAVKASNVPDGQTFSVTLNGRRVVCEEWGEGPTVYLLHGWGGQRSDFQAFLPPLVAAGFRVVAIDVPSHGESAPGRYGRRQSVLPEFADALAEVVDRAGPAHAVVGHSAGAACAARTVLDGLRVQRLALVAPMDEFTYYTDQFRSVLGYGDRIAAGFRERLVRLADRPLADYDIARSVGGRSDLPPLLVVHDEKDRRNPYAHGAAIAQAWPQGRLHPTTGLGHRRILSDPGVVQTVVEFLRR